MNLRVALPLLMLCLLVPGIGWAVSAAPLQVQLRQADDGSTFWAIPRGSERGDWLETLDGYTIVEDAGIWYYAQQAIDETLVPSAVRVGALSSVARRAWPLHLHPPLLEEEENTLRPLGLQTTSAGTRSLVRTQRVLTILVSFTDISFSYPDSAFQSLMYGASGSVKDFYLQNSYGSFTVLPAAETYGTANDGVVHVTISNVHPNLGNSSGMWRTLIGAYISAADLYVNFASFDTNADGNISSDELSIMLVLAGYENSYFNSLTPRIWAHKSSVSPTLTLDGKSVAPYAVTGERHGNSVPGTHMGTMGVFCHELGHLMLGYPDLYDVDNSSEGIGEWCLMGTGSWNGLGFAGDTPSQLSAWCKSAVDMVTPDVLEKSTTAVSILESDSNASIKKIWIDPYQSPRGEYFLLENRQFSGYDQGIPGDGLLIWHIDSSRLNNSNEADKLVDLEEADGADALDLAINRGDVGDPFPGYYGITTFNGATYPNSDDYHGIDTGIAVDAISASGPAMTVNVTANPTTGESLYYNERGRSNSWGFGTATCWTAVVYTNNTLMNRLDGFEVQTNADATVDFRLYQSLNGNTPTTLLYSQIGFVSVGTSWNRFILATPQPFPAGSTRVVVLKIVSPSNNFPASTDDLGVNSGRGYIDADGAGAFSPANGDLAQTALLGNTQLETVYVNFSFTGIESGTITNPYNTFAEGLSGVLPEGTINLNGTAGDRVSGWTGTIDTAVTITASPAGPVQIGVNGGQS